MDFGRLIFEGSAAPVAAGPIVREAYLGSESRSGATEPGGGHPDGVG
jgi:hypothetical protein